MKKKIIALLGTGILITFQSALAVALSGDLKFPMAPGGDLEVLSKAQITAILTSVKNNMHCTTVRIPILQEQSPNSTTFNYYAAYWENGRKSNWIRTECELLGLVTWASPLGTPPIQPPHLTPGDACKENWRQWIKAYIAQFMPIYVSPFNESGGGDTFMIYVASNLAIDYPGRTYIGPDINTMQGSYSKLASTPSVEQVFEVHGGHDKIGTPTTAAEWQTFQNHNNKPCWATECAKGDDNEAALTVNHAKNGNVDVINIYQVFPLCVGTNAAVTSRGNNVLSAAGY